jgi:uncharacterized protein involved in response to NO
MTNQRHPSILLAYPFRLFFLLTGLYGALVIVAWIGFLLGGWTLQLGWSPLHWHSHEMIYGLVPAAIAGFVLTAVTNWTSAPPLSGRGLLLLGLLWLAGRLAFWGMAWLPLWLVALIDLAFLPTLALYLGIILTRHRNRRNLVLVAILALLTVGNVLTHTGFIQHSIAMINAGQVLGLNLIVLMMAVIAGRITPLFTRNWLNGHGKDPGKVTSLQWLDRLAIASIAVVLGVEVIALPDAIVGAAALSAGIINGARLLGWAGWRTLREPLLWILHLAYLWIVIALLLKGCSAFTTLVPATLWQHALGAGAIAGLILGVMTRVALGHSGRPMKLPRFAIVIYIAITLAAVLRMLTAMQAIDYRVGITLAALAWVTAFLAFVLVYWPILAAPRQDGRPG